MADDFDPTLSPYDDAAEVPALASQMTSVPMDGEVKRVILAINKGVRDAQNGYDKTIEQKPGVAATFQKNMIALLRLQLDAIRMNFEMKGGKLTPQAQTNQTLHQTVVMTNGTTKFIADLLSGQAVMGAPASVAVAEPLAGDGG